MTARLTQEEFIEKAKKIHAGRFDYGLVNYTDRQSVVKIICSNHGEFDQTPNEHLNGKGCHKDGNPILK